jgi:hypothetical protein
MPTAADTQIPGNEPRPDRRMLRLLALAHRQTNDTPLSDVNVPLDCREVRPLALRKAFKAPSPGLEKERQLRAAMPEHVRVTHASTPEPRGCLERTFVLPEARRLQPARSASALVHSGPDLVNSELISWTPAAGDTWGATAPTSTLAQRRLQPRNATPTPGTSTAPNAGSSHVDEDATSLRQTVRSRFAKALLDNGFTPQQFAVVFDIPAERQFERWARDPSARDDANERIAAAFLHDAFRLRQRFIAACHSSGLSLEQAARSLDLRLADVAAWLSSSPAEAVGQTKTPAPQKQSTLPPLVAPPSVVYSSSGTHMMQAIWGFVVSDYRRATRASRVLTSRLAMEQERYEFSLEAQRRSDAVSMGKRVKVGVGAVGPSDDSTTKHPSFSPSQSMEVARLTGVFLAKQQPPRSVEVDLAPARSVLAASPLIEHGVVRAADMQAAGESALPPWIAERPASPLRTTIAVERSSAPFSAAASSSFTAPKIPPQDTSSSSRALTGKRVVPLLIHDERGNLKARPRDPDALRLRATPQDRDRYLLEQIVSGLRFRNLANVYAKPTEEALDKLVERADELWAEDEEGDAALIARYATPPPPVHSDDEGQAQVPEAHGHGVLPHPPAWLARDGQPYGALDAPITSAPDRTAIDGPRELRSSQKPRPLLKPGMLARATAPDGFKPVEFDGRRLVTPSEATLRSCEKTLLRLMVDRRIRGAQAQELGHALGGRGPKR